MKRLFLAATALVVCAAAPGIPPAGDFILASTTSLGDTGLLDLLAATFRTQTGITVKAVVAGTGQSLAMARAGNADAVIAHSRADEDAFTADGFGIDPVTIMFNHFMVVGPAEDPAKAALAKDATAAFRAIAAAGGPFVSRGDKSGTHMRELTLWGLAGGEPEGKPWYVKSGSGMGQTLLIAREKKAYTLCDSATWGSFEKKDGLKVVFDYGDELRNTYRYIRTNESKHPTTNAAAARKFATFLCAPETMALIGGFKKDGAGASLFTPLGCPELKKAPETPR